MLKFIVGIALIAFTTFCGYFLSGKYRKRKAFFRQLRGFNDRFINEISYFRRPIEEFVAGYPYNGDFAVLLKSFFYRLKSSSAQDKTVLELSNVTFLSEEEMHLIEDYFLMLGKGDSLSQKNYFSSVKEKLVKLESETEMQAKRYGDLYIKIGFLCGLLFLILIV